MAAAKGLAESLKADITRVGNSSIINWFAENNLKLPTGGNLFDVIESGLEEGTITERQLLMAISELEENSDKQIHLFNAGNFKSLEKDSSSVLKHIKRKYGYQPVSEKWVTRQPRQSPTFISMFWNDGLIKIKFMEKQYDIEPNVETESFERIYHTICVVFLIDTRDGFTQIRYDKPASYHTHKDAEGKPTAGAYEKYYRELLAEMFPDIRFSEMNLNGVANYIAKKERVLFRLTKGITTITNNAKQSFQTATIKADIRDLPEYEAAAAKGEDDWLSEDLTGYWLASQSDGELTRDLYMRISRRQSQLRVQRGCLEKELNYGIEQVRKIQKGV